MKNTPGSGPDGRPPVQVHSFDVFDTVLTRAVAEPRGVFMAMRESIKDRGIPEELVRGFEKHRMSAEAASREGAVGRETDLPRIYRRLADSFGLSPAQTEFLMTAELETELEYCRAVPETLRRIKDLRDSGKRVVFVSDMYLSSREMGRIFAAKGIPYDEGSIYVSCEHGAGKSNGLFSKVLEKERCAPSGLEHVGDNFDVDVLPARRLGARALHFTDCHLNRYEKVWAAAGTDGEPLFWQELAAVSRLARLALAGRPARERSMGELFASLAGPVFFFYVLWVVRRARESGVERLYFLSRDGRVLLRIAEELQRRLGLSLELRYLNVSRQALAMPSFSSVDDFALGWMLGSGDVFSPAGFSRRAGIDVKEMASDFERFTGKRLNAGESRFRSDTEFARFLNSPDFLEKLRKRAAALRTPAAAYLRREGVGDAKRWALVDLGWKGTIQGAIGRILALEGKGGPFEVRGYYLGTLAPSEDASAAMEHFLFDGSRCPSPPIDLTEILASANHGMVSGYDSEGRPLFRDYDTASFEAAGILGLEAAAAAYLDAFAWRRLDRAAAVSSDEVFGRFDRAMRLLYDNPSREEAEALGDWPFSSEQSEAVMAPFAPPVSVRRFLRYVIGEGPSRAVADHKRILRSDWPEGSLARSGPAARALYRAAVRTGSLLSSMRKAFVRT